MILGMSTRSAPVTRPITPGTPPAAPWRARLAHQARRLRGLGLGLAVGLAGVAAASLAPIAPWADVEQNLGLQWLFTWRGPVPAPSEVVVVAIDEASAQSLGLAARPRDWPRHLHAELVGALGRAGASVICFDLSFETPSRTPQDDTAFAAAMAQAGNVLLTESVQTETIVLPGADGRPLGEMVVERAMPPLPMFQDAALAHLPFMLPKAARVDRYWTFQSQASDRPTLPVRAFEVHVQRVAETLPAPQRQRLAAVLADVRAGPGSRYLNFYGPPRSIRTQPYAQVLGAARGDGLDPAQWRGKAVFVGYSARSATGQDLLRDDYRTVYSPPDAVETNGVEIAATAFANLLEDRPVRRAGGGAQLAVLMGGGLLLGVGCRRLRPRGAALFAAGLAAAWLAAACGAFTSAAWWLPFVVPLGLQLPLALTGAIGLNNRELQAERERVRAALGHYLPDAVVEQLTRQPYPGSPGSAARDAVVFGTCLATDAERYTTLAEAMPPAPLTALLNRYYAHLFVPVERRGGSVIDVVGDAMVAVWARADHDAAADRQPDPAQRAAACRAALDIVTALERARGGTDAQAALPTRFGLHAGEMLIGSVGASGHFEYRAVGDIVNTASRLQGLNKRLGTRVLASDITVQDLGAADGLHLRPLGDFLLAGKSRPVAVIELRAAPATPDHAADDAAFDAEFAQALAHHAAQRWGEAAERFDALARRRPEDGPSRFYATRCRELLTSPAGGDASPVVRIDGA